MEAAKPVGAHRLHDADEHVAGKVLLELGFVDGGALCRLPEIEVEQLVAQVEGKVRLRVIKERGDVVLERPLAAPLVVDEVGLAVLEHDVARLELAAEEEIPLGRQQVIGESRVLLRRSSWKDVAQASG